MATKSIAGNARKSASKYQTEADGRAYAIVLLQAFEHLIQKGNESSVSHHSASADGEGIGGEVSIYRREAQTRMLARGVGRLYRLASKAALNGFWVVLTDALGSAIDDAMPPAAEYAAQEAAGRLPRWGSTIYADDAAARAALAKGETAYRAGR